MARATFIARRGVIAAAAVLPLVALMVFRVQGSDEESITPKVDVTVYPTPDQETLTEEQAGSYVDGSLTVLRTDTDSANDVNWAVLNYRTTVYECLDAQGSKGSTGFILGTVGGCGLPSGTGLDTAYLTGHINAGPEDTNSQFAYVVFGRLSSNTALTAKSVKVTWSNGSTGTSTLANRAWLLVPPGPGSGTLSVLDLLGRNVLQFEVTVPLPRPLGEQPG